MYTRPHIGNEKIKRFKSQICLWIKTHWKISMKNVSERDCELLSIKKIKSKLASKFNKLFGRPKVVVEKWLLNLDKFNRWLFQHHLNMCVAINFQSTSILSRSLFCLFYILNFGVNFKWGFSLCSVWLPDFLHAPLNWFINEIQSCVIGSTCMEL